MCTMELYKKRFAGSFVFEKHMIIIKKCNFYLEKHHEPLYLPSFRGHSVVFSAYSPVICLKGKDQPQVELRLQLLKHEL